MIAGFSLIYESDLLQVSLKLKLIQNICRIVVYRNFALQREKKYSFRGLLDTDYLFDVSLWFVG